MGVFVVSLFFILICICIFCFAGIIIGIIGLVYSIKKTEIKSRNAMIVIFSVILALSLLFTAIGAASIPLVVQQDNQLPEGFVETDIVIDEDSYVYPYFTANGVVYKSSQIYVSDTETLDDPIFSYKPSGLFGATMYENFYRVENEAGFDLVSDEWGEIYCPEYQMQKVTSYYSDKVNLHARYVYSNETYYILTSDEFNDLWTLIDSKSLSLDWFTKQQIITLNEKSDFNIELTNKSGSICINNYHFLSYEGSLYYVYNHYYLSYDESEIEYVATKLPDDIAEPIFKLHEYNKIIEKPNGI